MNRHEAVDFLHNKKGYSRRLSAKLVNVALSNNEGMMVDALRKCLERGIEKQKKKIKLKYIIKGDK